MEFPVFDETRAFQKYLVAYSSLLVEAAQVSLSLEKVIFR
jgi:hypothetical protein